MAHNLLRGTAIVSALTVVSRIFGFVRDLLVARLFGAGAFADCFFVAFRIPNLLRSFVAEGALTSAFVPVFSDQIKQGPEVTQRTLSNVIGFLLLLTGVICLLGVLFAPLVISLIAPGFERDPSTFSLCVELTRIMFPYVIFISLVAMVNGALNTVQIFGAGAIAQVVMNLVLIAGALLAAFYSDEAAVRILSYSVIAGGAVQVAVQLPALRRAGLVFKPAFRFDASIRQLLWLMLPAVVGASVYQISQFISTQLATLLPTGSVSWLFYADRLTQFPIGIFSIALASVLLPTLSGARASNDEGNFRLNLENSLRYTSFIMLPVAAGLYIFAEPLISWIFERGAFTAEDTLQSAFAVRMYAVGLWGISCHSMLSRALIARKDTVTPTVVGVFTLLLNVLLSIILMGPIAPVESSGVSRFLAGFQNQVLTLFPGSHLGHGGLALSMSISSTVSMLILSGLIARRVHGLNWSGMLNCLLRTGAACAAAAGAVHLIGAPLTSHTWNVLLQIGLFCFVFAAAAALLRCREMKETLALLGRWKRR